jgi:sugar/nucleoside kinase (ribokinase family)
VRVPFRVPPPGSRRFDVAGLGLNSIDLLAVVAEHPHPNSKQRLQRFARMPGGQIATALSACARLGWTATYVGSFGDDDFGRLSRDSLTSVGVDVAGARTIAGATSQFAIVIVDARSGDRTVLWDRHPALTMGAADVPREVVTSGRLLVVDCHDTAAAAQAAKYAREAGIPTIVDVERVRPGISELLQHIDAIIAAESFPLELTGHDDHGRAIAAIANEFHAPLVTVTLGAAGSLTTCGGREFRTPGFAVACVDTTGAGDAFRGGFAAGLLEMPDGDIEDVLVYANAVAALNCRGLGARGGLPTRDEVDALVAGRTGRAAARPPFARSVDS